MEVTTLKSKVCFVIMGFGKKSDPESKITYDLDKTYKNIIRPAVIEAGYECVRADEILDSGLIDKSMYALLMQADLVIADITTYNPNAIYELGIRHGVRPQSTIILKEKNGKIPFDLDHNTMCMYTHMGEDIGYEEVIRCKNYLISLIENISKQQQVDSPLYQFINNINPPVLPQEEYISLIDDLAEKENLIFAVVEKAKAKMSEGDFESAAKYWDKAHQNAPNEPYFIQQKALSVYKSEVPSPATALTDALNIISELSPDEASTNDPETLGITGAIYKNQWLLSGDIASLERAITYYGKCFNIRNDYYTGENYALCLDMKSNQSKDAEEKIYAKFEAKKTREKIVSTLLDIIEYGDFDTRIDRMWIYATLSHCYLALGNDEEHHKFEALFMTESPVEWQVKTYETSKQELVQLHGGK
ncbi:tetratricopeptide repeat-containing protein [Pseudoalteromonas sp. S16_S37]|uniref:tetratricopeptide repeat-containing protein n=1 Tax=Pseudoalteromonas sp. S16_S37 TaxID=2720228 RepID=UPI0016815DC0|nr:tetratricopeptide repeat-containing protein [Pseudoalteromonas sp. S16_S37]MBD1582876.1 DUF4071 domain-containing protein [Pseudoalteromonas sp. S16_S37]